MAKETVELPDGRYLIYYTFGSAQPAQDPGDQELAQATDGKQGGPSEDAKHNV